ncbi:MAG: IS630 family transposase [Solirubrobacteraceae bacterium]
MSPRGWTVRRTVSLGEEPGFELSGWMGLKIKRGRDGRVVFPPEEVAEVKAIACELPRTHELPLSRFSRVELHRLVVERGVTEASASTIWRWLHEDAIKPWQTRSWIFPRDPEFATKAARVLDLYARVFDGKRLRPDEYVISADEKTQLQALGRHHETVAPGPGRPGLVEFEYLRGGTLAYLAAWDVHHANLFDRVEQTTGIDPFHRLVDQVMQVEPYQSARTVYWVVDNGSSHAGKTSVKRITEAYPNAKLIHLPVRASWLNQIEIYFSILQRKALTPNDLATLPELARHLMDFAQHYRTLAQPFEWTFTRAKLNSVIEKITRHKPQPLALAA